MCFDPVIVLVGGVWCTVGGCDLFVVFFYYLCHVVCAAVANLDVVFIEDFGLGAIIGEVFRH